MLLVKKKKVLCATTILSTVYLIWTKINKLAIAITHKITNTLTLGITIYLMYKLHCPHSGTLAPGVKFCGFSTPRPLLGAVRPAETPEALPVG